MASTVSTGHPRGRQFQQCLRPAAAVVWALGLAFAGFQISRWVPRHYPWGMDWRVQGNLLLDYRDLVVVPGRYLWSGGNPYDPLPYLAAHPWAQEFDPYTPSWLLISLALGPLPIEVGATIYLVVCTALLALLSVWLVQWAWRRSYLISGLLFLWLLVWSPTRWLTSSFIVFFGFALAVREMRKPGGGNPWMAAVGLSIAMFKPQFGVPIVVVVLMMRRWDAVWRTVVMTVVASAAPLGMCIKAAGGVVGFIDSIVRVIQHATSPAAPTGLLSPYMFRTDAAGLFTRVTGTEPPTALTLGAAAIFLGVCVFIWRGRPSWDLVCGLMVPPILLLPVHLDYDMVFLLAPAAGALAWWRGHRSPATLAFATASLLPILHLHKVSMDLLGVSRLAADLIDMALAVVVLLLAITVTLMAPKRQIQIGNGVRGLAGGASG
ncbi:DUF2029 domain-containing protein [Nigerium massiliense]|uniref:DUF2029 domain-containing protein n=1 Tax=Nigerium massiliense TaxID=1522317 RepID=UPI00058D9926|nr:DUF2029 domain-containing protein [Nigerium massiliense]